MKKFQSKIVLLNFYTLLEMEEIVTGNLAPGIEYLENKRLLEKYVRVWLPILRVGDLDTDTECKGENRWSENRVNIATGTAQNGY